MLVDYNSRPDLFLRGVLLVNDCMCNEPGNTENGNCQEGIQYDQTKRKVRGKLVGSQRCKDTESNDE